MSRKHTTVSALTYRLSGGSVAALLAALALGTGSAFAWHGPPPVTIQRGGDVVRIPRIATNESGAAVAAWRQLVDEWWFARAAVRDANGEWQEPAMLSGSGRDALALDVAMSAGGLAVAAWQSWDGSASTIEASVRAPGGGWEPAQTISSAGHSAVSPHVAVDDAGAITAVWISAAAAGAGAVHTASRPAGGSWSTPQALSGGGARELSLDASGSGHLAAVWRGFDGTNNRIEVTVKPSGGTWSMPQWLSAPGEDARAPDVSIDETGNALAVWERWDARYTVLQYAERPAGGSWSRGREIAPGTGPRKTVQIETGAGGHSGAIWSSAGSRFVTFRPPGGGWRQADFAFYSEYPELAIDRQGNAVLVWTGVGARWKPVGEGWKDMFDLSPDIYDTADPDVGTHGPGQATAVWARGNGAIQASSFDIDSGQEGYEDEIEGTDGDDELEGTNGDDVFRTYGGNDKIFGRGGNDIVYAGPGNDRVFGGRGHDVLIGGRGRDSLWGGAGRDELRGGAGHDALAGQLGRDFLWARDRLRDRVTGGPGLDRYRVDQRDKLVQVELPF